MIKSGNFPLLGCGVGLRPPHYQTLLNSWPKTVDWFEAISENYMDSAGRPIQILEAVRQHYPIALHGVSLSIGSADPLKTKYLIKLKALADRIEPAIISDHLCWSGVDQEELHDLLPLPFTTRAIDFIVARVGKVQDFLKRRILLENVSTYVTFASSEMSENEFLIEVAKRSGCGLLLDINNVHVNAQNHDFDSHKYIESIPGELVGQFHVAGHMDRGKFLFDTHEGPIVEAVWNLYAKALQCYGQVSTLIEWDTGIPEFQKLEDENARAQHIYSQYDCHPVLDEKTKVTATPSTTVEKIIPQDDDVFESELKNLQCWFRDQLQSHHPAKDVQSLLNRQAGDPGITRLEVYADNYYATTFEALAEVFSTIQHLVGEKAFSSVVYDYAQRHKSNHYNLGERGEEFAEFLLTAKVTEELPFLPDLAKLERFIAKSFHSPTFPPANLSELQSVPPEDWELAHINFQPTMFVMTSKWPIYDLWCSRETPTNQINLQVEGSAQSVLIFRNNYNVQVELIAPWKYQLFDKLSKGYSLGRAIDFLLEEDGNEESASRVMSCFSQWVQLDLITHIEIKPISSV